MGMHWADLEEGMRVTWLNAAGPDGVGVVTEVEVGSGRLRCGCCSESIVRVMVVDDAGMEHVLDPQDEEIKLAG